MSDTGRKVEPGSVSDLDALDEYVSRRYWNDLACDSEHLAQHEVPIGNLTPPNVEDALGVKILFLEKILHSTSAQYMQIAI
jgi:hypothetical protein